MFYGQFVLSKKGPLARIWLAAHWEKKLTKAQIFDTDIDKAVDYILEPPKIRMALRTTGHLLLGVVKIYSRKAKYLLTDCNDTCTRIRLAFRPHAVVVDLPENNNVAAFDAITYPEIFHDFDAAGMNLSLNQSRYQDITMTEYVPVAMNDVYDIGNDFGFGDDEIELRRGASGGRNEWNDVGNSGMKLSGLDDERLSGNRIDHGQNYDEANMGMGENMEIDGKDAGDNDNFNPIIGNLVASSPAGKAPRTPTRVPVSPIDKNGPPASEGPKPSDVHGMTTLLSNAAEGFVLGPLDEATILGLSRQRGVNRKRRRCLMVDKQKSIPTETMKNHISNYKDTIRPLDLAPETKRKMYLKERESADYLFTHTALECGSKQIFELFRLNLKSRDREDERVDAQVGITLVDHVQHQDAIQLDPIIEDVEMGRNVGGGGLTPQRPYFSPIAEEGESGERGSQPNPFDLQMPVDGLEQQQQQEQGLPFFSPSKPVGSSSPRPMPMAMALDEPAPVQNEQMMANSFRSPTRSPTKERRSRASQQDEIGEDEQRSEWTPEEAPRWSEIGNQMLGQVRQHVKESESENERELVFYDLLNAKDTRKSVARKFYALLVLKKLRSIDVAQTESYGDIAIKAGPEIDTSFQV